METSKLLILSFSQLLSCVSIYFVTIIEIVAHAKVSLDDAITTACINVNYVSDRWDDRGGTCILVSASPQRPRGCTPFITIPSAGHSIPTSCQLSKDQTVGTVPLYTPHQQSDKIWLCLASDTHLQVNEAVKL